MASAAPNIDFRSLSTSDPNYQAQIDVALFQAVAGAKQAEVEELITLGANPTSIQKKGRSGTSHALLTAIQVDMSESGTSKLLPALLKAKSVRTLPPVGLRMPSHSSIKGN